MAIMAAIFHLEGAFTPGAAPWRHCNPADLRSWGDVPVVKGFAQFPSMVQGVRAAYLDIVHNVSLGLTLRQFINKFAPPSDENNTDAYLAFVSLWTGIAPDEPI